MTLLRQALATAGLALVLLVVWAVFVPASQPWLARIGLLDPMTRIGIVSAPSEPQPAGAARRGGGGAVRVIASEPVPTVMNDIVTAIGTASAVRSVALTPEVGGRVVQIHAGPGDRAKTGDLLVELDSEAAIIALDRAELLRSDAQASVTRFERLTTSGAASDVQRQDAQLALRTAELGVRQAAFDLAQRKITAPISGWLGLLSVEVGDQVSPGDVITQIDDRSRVTVNFRVPERLVRNLKLGDAVSAVPLGEGGDPVDGTIRALDNRVDMASRSLQVEADIPNADDRFRSGMAFSVTLRQAGETHPAVDPLAVQWGAEGAFVWVLRDGRASQLPVRILQRNADAILLAATFEPGDLVVSEGVQSLRPGVEAEAVTPGARPAANAATAPDAQKT